MLENKRSRVYCFCAVRSYHRSSRSAPKTRSREARTMTEMGLFCTNRSNTSPSMAASLMTKLKKAYRTQDRHTLTPLVHTLLAQSGIGPRNVGMVPNLRLGGVLSPNEPPRHDMLGQRRLHVACVEVFHQHQHHQGHIQRDIPRQARAAIGIFAGPPPMARHGLEERLPRQGALELKQRVI